MKQLFLLTIIALILQTCTPPQPVKRFTHHTDAPKLYEAISVRDANALLMFTDHVDLFIRRQAWRALFITKVDPDVLLEKALATTDELAWFAVSGHPMKPQQLRSIEQYYAEAPQRRNHVLRALAAQGDQISLQFLLQQADKEKRLSKDMAKAIGQITFRVAPDAGSVSYIIDLAIKSQETVLSRHLLYPFYRSNRLKISKDDATKLLVRIKSRKDPDLLRQYMIRMVSRDYWTDLKAIFPNSMSGLSYNEAIEWIRVIPRPITDAHAELMVAFLDHPNPNVNQEVLQHLKASKELPQTVLVALQAKLNAYRDHDMHSYIASLFILVQNRTGEVRNEADELDALIVDNPHVADAIFQFRMLSLSENQMFDYLRPFMKHEDTVVRVAAVKALTIFFNGLPPERMKGRADITRSYLFEALSTKDRGVMYELANAFKNNLLYREEDFPRLKRVLENLDVKADVEVFQALGNLLWKQSGEAGRALLKQYMEMNYAPLNAHLARAGIPATVPEQISAPLLTPNWNVLKEFGEAPVWILETEKGVIEMMLDPLRAPATVYAIDSLSRTGKYDNVPFHRVVANFVIQGGDFERRDGLGGPTYQLPTEPSELSFKRGSLGMASAGSDTEGSQFFIMHQDAPHLNGRYTRFGEVTEGLNVVDSIQPGDLVLKSRVIRAAN